MKWDKVKLDDVCVIVAGQSPPSEYYNQSGKGMPFFQGKADFGYETPIVRYYCTKPTKKAYPNDILMSVRAPVGPTNICNTESCIGRGLAAIRSTDKAYYKYIYYWFKSIEDKLSNMGNGSTFSAITTQVLRDLEIPLPPLHIQKQIADTLDKADALRRKDQQLLQKYDDLAQAIFYDMFGDPVKNEKGWEVRTFEEVARKEKFSIVDGPFGSSLNEGDYHTSGVPIIRINNIRDSGYYDDEYKFILKEKYEHLIRSKVSFGDILIARVGNTIGKSCIFDKTFPALLSTTGVCKISLDETTISNTFFSVLINLPNYRKYILSNVQGAGQPYMNLTTIKSFKVILPPKVLQNTFITSYEKVKYSKVVSQNTLMNSTKLFKKIISTFY